MRLKSAVRFLSIVIVGAFLVVIGAKIADQINRKPVGTPRTYTTFITDSSTATPDVFLPTPTPLTLPDCVTQPAPTNGMLVFRVWTDRADKELFRADSDGENICQLTDNIEADDQPSISPDGTKVAFVSFLPEKNYRQAIFIMDVDGANRTLLTDGGSAYSFPDWSPDGKKLIFQATINELFDLYTINTDGSNLRNLTNDVTLDITPAWSPDGRHIAFASDRTFDPNGFVSQGDSFEIYVMDSDGANVRRLTNNQHTDISPVWSPDGQKIAYESDSEIYVMNINGDGYHSITNSGYAYAGSPVWLPDGQHIAFVSAGHIYTTHIGGSNSPQSLVQGMGFSQLDAWWPPNDPIS